MMHTYVAISFLHKYVSIRNLNIMYNKSAQLSSYLVFRYLHRYESNRHMHRYVAIRHLHIYVGIRNQNQAYGM